MHREIGRVYVFKTYFRILLQAARAASSAAQSLQMRDDQQEGEQPDADLPAFGSGIEFVPRQKADAGVIIILSNSTLTCMPDMI